MHAVGNLFSFWRYAVPQYLGYRMAIHSFFGEAPNRRHIRN